MSRYGITAPGRIEEYGQLLAASAGRRPELVTGAKASSDGSMSWPLAARTQPFFESTW